MNKKAGIRFNPEYYVDVNMDDMMLKVETPEGVTEYPLEGGGSYTEELLWENPDASVDFASSIINTNNISQYDFIKIIHKTTLTDATKELISIYPIENTDSNYNFIGLIGYATTSKRAIQILNDAALQISDATRWTSSGTLNNTVIPLAIYGMK